MESFAIADRVYEEYETEKELSKIQIESKDLDTKTILHSKFIDH